MLSNICLLTRPSKSEQHRQSIWIPSCYLSNWALLFTCVVSHVCPSPQKYSLPWFVFKLNSFIPSSKCLYIDIFSSVSGVLLFVSVSVWNLTWHLIFTEHLILFACQQGIRVQVLMSVERHSTVWTRLLLFSLRVRLLLCMIVLMVGNCHDLLLKYNEILTSAYVVVLSHYYPSWHSICR